MGNMTMKMMFQNVIDSIDEVLDHGDPTVKEWFLVKSKVWPLLLSLLYVMTVKKLGPCLMKNRKPFELRKAMLIYNLLLVLTYSSSVSVFLYKLNQMEGFTLCREIQVSKENSTYTFFACGWIVYILKYIEFLDTIFFVLRKKENLITNLHVFHHMMMPIIGWIMFRTERSGFQAYPIIINSIVHIVMYSYYGLAAIGPSVRKYLWWKKYITMMQMIQFILIVFTETVMPPLMGCVMSKISIITQVALAIIFFCLFFNFYVSTFRKQSKEKSF